MKGSGRKASSVKIQSNIQAFCLFFLISSMLACNSNDISQNRGDGMVHVKVVSLEKCSATDLTIALIHEVAGETGVEIDFEHVIVKTREDAIARRHIGSPTVQVNGLDIDRGAREINQFGVT